MRARPEGVEPEGSTCLATEPRPVRVGVIGCGYWGPKLVRNFSRLSAVSVPSISDLRAERRDAIRADYPALTTLADYRDLLHGDRLDAVAIATPVETHYGLTREALEAGLDVLVEKPLCQSTHQAQELVKIAREHDRILMVDHTFLFTGAVEKIQELVSAGELGRVLYFDSVRINLGLFQHDVNVLWDLAPHDLSILLHVLPEMPMAVSALGVSHSSSPQESIAYLTFFYPDGTLAHIHVNWMAPVKVRRIILGGDRKMLVYDDMEASEKVKVYDKGVDAPEEYQTRVQYRVGDMWAPRIDSAEALHKECQYFVDCVRQRTQPFNDGVCGTAVVRLLEAASRSLAQGGARVDVV